MTDRTYIMLVQGQHLHFRVFGEEQKPALVLLHGYGTSGHIWQYALPHLAQHHQLFIVDLPGFGRSKMPIDWRLRGIAPILQYWLQEIQLAEVAVMGHSMGGAIAIHLAALAPDIIKQLILVNAAGIPLQAPLSALTLRALRSFLQTGNGSYPLPLIRDTLPPRICLLWRGAQEMIQSDFREELAQITIPTLIIWGERDVMLPVTLGQSLHEALPHAQLHTFPHCGHRPMLAYPAEFSKMVQEFLLK